MTDETKEELSIFRTRILVTFCLSYKLQLNPECKPMTSVRYKRS